MPRLVNGMAESTQSSDERGMKMKKEFEPLFTGFNIGSVTFRNRIAMSPMGTHNDGPRGELTDSQYKYYEDRARGGCGLIIMEGQQVTNKTEPWLFHYKVVDTEEQMQCWAKVAERIHAHGSKMALQLCCGLGKNAFNYGDEGAIKSASAIPSFYRPDVLCEPLTVEEIHDIVGCFGRAANRALRAEVDMIVIHTHAGYMMDQFMSSQWNHRTDEYGGTFENRMRFLHEAYDAIRKNAPGIPVIAQLALEHKYEGGRTVEEGIQIAKYVEKMGVDGIMVDVGAYENKQWTCPSPYQGDAAMLYAAKILRKEVSVPILNVGTYTPETAAKAVADGDIDIAVIGRGLIADPDFANKLREGREEDIRPCLSCNFYCVKRLHQNRTITCAVNARAAHEIDYPMDKAERVRKIAVVGGGPGGLEAARVAALRGHNVTVYEKSDTLGGQLIFAGEPPFKNRIRAYREWQIRQIKKLPNVSVVYNKTITADSKELADADEIVVAIGASPLVPPIKGIDLPNVAEVTAAHADPSLIKGDKIVITGGGMSGCDCALELAMAGKDVTIVEMLDGLGLKEIINNRIAMLEKLNTYGVKQLVKTKVVSITPEGVMVENENGTQLLEADTVISAFGMRSRRSEADAIFAKYPFARMVGDCVSVGQIGEAVRAGFFAGWSFH